MSAKLKYILMGNILNKKEIGELPKSNEQVFNLINPACKGGQTDFQSTL